MKKLIILIIFLMCTGATLDPNTPVVPPKPGEENITKVDSETLRITTSTDIQKATLLAQRKSLVAEKTRIEKQIAEIDAKLEKLKTKEILDGK